MQGLKARGINPIEQRRKTEQQAKDKTVKPEVVTLEQASSV
ncbi:hypothetical protein [Thiomicrorhabdus aquaedulcis]|nr:hypothetical protein [Thiomicrorhabdus aquaedulcis]